jgi:hypothetical protein
VVLLAALAVSAGLLGAPPYVGVACPEANSIACDRIGVAVWVRGPARAVRAVVAGRDVRLRPAWTDARGRAWTGYVRRAGLRDGALRVPADGRGRWFGQEAPEVRVRVVVVRRTGVAAGVTRVVALRPGWG